MLMGLEAPCVAHVTTLQDEDGAGVLARTTQVLANRGARQWVLMLDHGLVAAPPDWRARLAAEMRVLDCAGLSRAERVDLIRTQLVQLAGESGLCAIHLHGVDACLLGWRALKGIHLQARILYSPYRARLGSRWASAFLYRRLQRDLAPVDYSIVATSLAEAEALSRLLNRSAEVLPHPVSETFFAASRQEAERPRVFADGSGVEAVNLVARLCVLLNGREARVPFAWLGNAEPREAAQLEAAGVQLLPLTADAERALALSGAWLYLQVSPSQAVPLPVAQAMAAGIACLASDTPAHRALIHHGETGYICTSERDFVERIVLLLRDREERRRLGAAARAEAERRFTLRHFEGAILRAYRLSGSAPLPVLVPSNGEDLDPRTYETHFIG